MSNAFNAHDDPATLNRRARRTEDLDFLVQIFIENQAIALEEDESTIFEFKAVCPLHVDACADWQERSTVDDVLCFGHRCFFFSYFFLNGERRGKKRAASEWN